MPCVNTCLVLEQGLRIIFLVFQNVSVEGTEEEGNDQFENSIFPFLPEKETYCFLFLLQAVVCWFGFDLNYMNEHICQ